MLAFVLAILATVGTAIAAGPNQMKTERFLIISPHTPEMCLKALDEVQAKSPKLLAQMALRRELPGVRADAAVTLAEKLRLSDNTGATGLAVGNGSMVKDCVASGNATGFFATEPSLGGKWLELLKEIVPGLRRVAVIFNPETSKGGTSYLHSVETAATLFSVEATGAPVHHVGDIELAISSLVREPGGGLIVLNDAFTASHHKQIIELAARYRLPAIYGISDYADMGGLMAYGIDPIARYRQAASYVDQILKGANPANLPVQAPTKLGLVINLKTAKALGLTVPPSVLAQANEVIE